MSCRCMSVIKWHHPPIVLLCRLRRLLPTEAKAKVDNSLRDLHNASHHMKAEFIFWGSIPRSSPSLEHFRHSSFYFCTNTFKIPCYAAKRPLWACNEQPIPGQLGLGPHLALIVYKGQIKYFFSEGTEEMAICGRNQNMPWAEPKSYTTNSKWCSSVYMGKVLLIHTEELVVLLLAEILF